MRVGIRVLGTNRHRLRRHAANDDVIRITVVDTGEVVDNMVHRACIELVITAFALFNLAVKQSAKFTVKFVIN